MGAAGAIAAGGAWRSQRIMVTFMALDACCRGNALIYMRLKFPLIIEWERPLVSSGMARAWLIKNEPDCYSFDDLLRDGRVQWDGVRNYQARNYMRDE